MKITSVRSRLRTSLSVAVTIVLAAGIALSGATSASANAAVLCKGYAGCEAYGMTNHGYAAKSGNWYWRMYPGHNCTNYAAYMMVRAGAPNVRPWTNATGNAAGWGVGMADKTNSRPAVGAIAWWDGGSGHVAYVEAVLSSDEIIISEDSWGGDFYWRIIKKSQGGWPKGFIHVKDSSTSGVVPEWRAKPYSTTIYKDATRATLANTAMMKPGSTAWVELKYLNTGRETWVGKQLATQAPEDHESKFASGWMSPSRAAVQSEASVPPGGVATFAFAITVPTGYADGTQLTETFAPVHELSQRRIAYGNATITVTSDNRNVFAATPTPAVSGTPAEEKVLSATSGTWKPTASTVSYQWRRDGVAISGATGATYALNSLDVGRAVSVSVTAKATNYVPATKTSAATAVVKSKFPSSAVSLTTLKANDQLVSANGRYRILQKSTGSLIVQDRFTNAVLWSNNQVNKASYTTLTAKGSLASYSASGALVWKSPTAGKGVTNFAITTGGKLILRDAANAIIWTAN